MNKLEDGVVVYTNSTVGPDDPDLRICKTVYEELNRHYPNHAWFVECNSASGHGVIKLLYSGPNGRVAGEGCLFHLKSLDDARGFRLIKAFGGELLERFGIARRGVTPEAKLCAISHGLDKS